MSQDIVTNLGHYWPMDGSLGDAAGGADFSGTPSGYEAGTVGQRVVLGTTNLTAGDPATADFDASSSFSIAGWFTVIANPAANKRLFSKKAGTSAAQTGWLLYMTTSGNVAAMIADGTTRAFWFAGGTNANGTPVHFAFTLNRGTQTGSIYRNGAFVTSTPGEGPVSSVGSLVNSEAITIEGDASVTVMADDLRIYPGRVLSAADVAWLYRWRGPALLRRRARSGRRS